MEVFERKNAESTLAAIDSDEEDADDNDEENDREEKEDDTADTFRLCIWTLVINAHVAVLLFYHIKEPVVLSYAVKVI